MKRGTLSYNLFLLHLELETKRYDFLHTAWRTSCKTRTIFEVDIILHVIESFNGLHVELILINNNSKPIPWRESIHFLRD